MAKLPIRSRSKLIFPQGKLAPLTIATFVEMEGFTEDWKDLNLTDDDLQAMQIIIMTNPQGPPVVKGTGGLRKLRFAPASLNRGKSGAHRIGYAYFETYKVVLLIIAYSKKDKDDLSPAQAKVIKRLISEVEKYLASTHYRWTGTKQHDDHER